MDERDILYRVLTIIGYSDSKLEFINKFFSFIYIESIARLSTELSLGDQKRLGEELNHAQDDEEQQKEIILKYLPKEQFEEIVAEVSEEQFRDYLGTIMPTLSEEKQMELTDFLSSLQKPEA
jgi:hypothetical protein